MRATSSSPTRVRAGASSRCSRGTARRSAGTSAEIETTALLEADLRPGRQTPADVVAAFRAQGDEGIEHVIVNLPDAHVIERLDAFGREIIPAVA